MRSLSPWVLSLFLFFFLFLAAFTAPSPDPHKGYNKTLSPWYSLCEKSGFFSAVDERPAQPNSPPGLEGILKDLSSICMDIKRYLIENDVPLSSASGDSTTTPAAFTKKTTMINTVCAVASLLVSLGVAVYTALKEQAHVRVETTANRLARDIANLQNARVVGAEEPAEPAPLQGFIELRRRVGRLETRVRNLEFV